MIDVSMSIDPQNQAVVIYETDWLASTPVFYNLQTGSASTNIHEVMPPYRDLRFHPEGFYNFLDFGYSVYGQTPVENVKFLSPGSRLIRDAKGHLLVEQLADPVERWWEYRISEADVIDLIRERVQDWEAALPSDREIVLPLSGGFDSRLLLWCLADKSRVRAYTYGLSEDQDRSIEVVHARALAERFGVRWERIPLGEFHRHFADWDAAYGISTHAHGMYHFEFYTKIRKRLKGQQAFLSGIFGDVWAGSILAQSIEREHQLVQLGYTHGLRADPARLLLPVQHYLREKFWKEQHDRLKNPCLQMVTTIRLKIMLISYLMRVPRLFDFEPWTPFLDIDIAMAMVNLPPGRRANRQWQRDFFTKVGLDLENRKLRSNRSNSLNHQAMKRYPVPPLNIALLADLFDADYLNWINKTTIVTGFSEIQSKILGIPKIGGLLRRFGAKDRNLEAYCAYLCLKPIENLLRRQYDAVKE